MLIVPRISENVHRYIGSALANLYMDLPTIISYRI